MLDSAFAVSSLPMKDLSEISKGVEFLQLIISGKYKKGGKNEDSKHI
jgi:hypothetical protein